MRPVVLTLGLLLGLAVTSRARAAPPRTAYVDDVQGHGDVDEDAARAFVARVVADAGYEARFREAPEAPCGDDAACLARRGRAARAEIALRATVLGLAGEVSVALYVVRTDTGRGSALVHRGVDLSGGDATVSGFLGSGATVPPSRSRRRVAAWATTGAAALLLAGGVVALVVADARRDEFFADHVDVSGNVVGISPDDAAAHEGTTRAWQLAGGVMLLGAGAAAVTATILFFGGAERGGPAPVGVGVAGAF